MVSSDPPDEHFVAELQSLRTRISDLEQRGKLLSWSDLLLRNLSAAIIVTDLDGVVTFWNENASRLYGWEAAEVLGRPYLEHLPAESREAIADWITKLHTGQEFHGDWHHGRKDGTKLWIQAHTRTLVDDQGAPIGLIGVSFDASERHRIEDELRLRTAAIENANDGIVIVDATVPELPIIYASRHYCDLTGYAEDEILGRNCRFIQGPDTDQTVRAEMRAAVAAGRPFRGLILNYRKDGTPFWNAMRIDPVRDATGAVVRFVGNMADVTGRVEAEHQWRATQELLTAVLENAATPIYVLDTADCYRLVNRRWEQTVGRQRDDVLGRPVAAILTAAAALVCQTLSRRVRETGAPASAEETYPGSDGPRFLHTIKFPLHGPGGEITAVGAVSIDVTEHKRAEAERERMRARLVQAHKLESLGKLAGGIAHDFNNLLTPILGYTALIGRLVEPASPIGPMLQSIEESGRRLAELTRQLLAFAGRDQLQFQTVDLSDVVERMRPLLRTGVGPEVDLRFELAAELPQVQADAAQLRQLLFNLTTNAAEALEQNKGVVLVRTEVIDADQAALQSPYHLDDLPPGRYVVLEVRDEGRGMDATTLDRLFDPFYSTKFTGRGLGLAAVLGIVRGHRGTIAVVSAPGRGCTIRVLLPEAPVRALSASAAVTKPGAPTRDQTVLIVEDSPDVRGLMAAFLTDAGYRVLTAVDGIDGEVVFSRNQADVKLVLLDLNMPRRGGVETLKLLRALAPDLPVLIMSGYNEEILADQFEGVAPTGFFAKPFEAEVLLRAVRAALAERP